MIIFNLFILLFSSALTMRKQSTVYYSRIVILTLCVSSLICYNNLYVTNLQNGIGLYGGIFNVNAITQSFSIFIMLISAIILIYNSFYHTTLINDESIKLGVIDSLISDNKEKLGKTSLNYSILGNNKPFLSFNKYIQSSLRKNKYNVIKNTILDDNNDTFKMGIYKIIEYPLIILFIITGGLFLMSSADLISIFISIELQSYGLYILSTLHRDSEQSTWGGLTYFLLGGLSSCFILLGSALLYINSGTTSLDGIYIISSITDIIPNNIGDMPVSSLNTDGIQLTNIYDYSYLNLSLIILSVGFLFKVSAAPFHFWSPDVYDAIPTAVTTYVAIIAKISIFIFLLELVYFMNLEVFEFSWKNCILISSLFSMIIGSVLGLTQFRLKKVYAYSTINHVGFILLALCINKTESIQAYIFYIISYTISNLNAFIILVTIGYTLFLYIERPADGKPGNPGVFPLKDRLDTNPLKIKSNNTQDNVVSDKSDSFSKDDFFSIFKPQDHGLVLHSSENLVSSKPVYNNNKAPADGAYTEKSVANNLKDLENSPIQLVSQLKGYFYINSYLALSLAITLFSFIGIPPLIGFFAKQMVLSAALDNGYIFITLVGILTSVIGAVYYLNIVKHIFFYKSDYILNPYLTEYNYFGYLNHTKGSEKNQRKNQTTTTEKDYAAPYTIYNHDNIKISSALSSIISILTLLIILFIFIPNESFNLAKILSLLLFN